MSALFTPRANFVARLSIILFALAIAALGVGAYGYVQSSYITRFGLEVEQTVPFSHEHHAGNLGIDCRYCHATVEQFAFAGMPSTQTCMNCHAHLWTNAKMLEPVRESWRTGMPLRWERVNALPDFVYFNHSIHVSKGVGCATCHGRVDQMKLMRKGATLLMRWCVDCHRDPHNDLRPADKIFDMAWKPDLQSPIGFDLSRSHAIQTDGLTDCSICHR